MIDLFNFDLVAAIFGGQQATLSRVIYALVGLSGLYSLTLFFADMSETDTNITTYILLGKHCINLFFLYFSKSHNKNVVLWLKIKIIK